MKFPATAVDLKAAGYEYSNDASCRGCGAPIEWWITPNNKKIPITVSNNSTITHAESDMRTPHWADCPEAESFRR